MVHDQRIGDDRIDRTLFPGTLTLTHSVANDLAAPEFDFFSVGGEVFFDFNEKLGVGQPNPIADSGAEHVSVGRSGKFCRHYRGPMIFC